MRQHYVPPTRRRLATHALKAKSNSTTYHCNLSEVKLSKVYFDGKRIGEIGADVPSKVVTFSFAPYSRLELREVDDESVIELISLEVGCKGMLFKSQLNVIVDIFK